jgi:hypothetical protein
MLPRFQRPGREQEQKRTSTMPSTPLQEQQVERKEPQPGVVGQVSNWFRAKTLGRRPQFGGTPQVGPAYFDPESQKIQAIPVGFPVFYDPMGNRATLEETGIPLVLPSRSGVDFTPLWGQYSQMLQQQMEMGGPEMYFDAFSSKVTTSPTQYPMFWDPQSMKPTFSQTGVPLRFDPEVSLTFDQDELSKSFAGVYGMSVDLTKFGFQQAYVKVSPSGGLELTNEKTAYPIYVDPNTGNPTTINTGIPYIPASDAGWDDVQSQNFLEDFMKNKGSLVSTQLSYGWQGGDLYFDPDTGGLSMEKTRYPIYDDNGNPTFQNTGRKFQYKYGVDDKLDQFGDVMYDEFFKLYGEDPIALLQMNIVLESDVFNNLTWHERQLVKQYGTPGWKETVERVEEGLPPPVEMPGRIRLLDAPQKDPAFEGKTIWTMHGPGGATPMSPTLLEAFGFKVERPEIAENSFQGGWIKGDMVNRDWFNPVATLLDLGWHYVGTARRWLENKFLDKERRDDILDNLNSAKTHEDIELALKEVDDAMETPEFPYFGVMGSLIKLFKLEPMFEGRSEALSVVPVDVDTWDIVDEQKKVIELKERGRNIQWMSKYEYNTNRTDALWEFSRFSTALWKMGREDLVTKIFDLPSDEEVVDYFMKRPQGELRLKQKEFMGIFEDAQKELQSMRYSRKHSNEELVKWWQDLMTDLGFTREDVLEMGGFWDVGSHPLGDKYIPMSTNTQSRPLDPGIAGHPYYMSMAVAEWYSENVLWGRARDNYLSGFTYLEQGDYSAAEEFLTRALEADWAGARGLFSPFTSNTIDLNEERLDRFMKDLVFATMQTGRILNEYEIWNIKRAHEDPFMEALHEIGSELVMVWPNVLAMGVIKGLGVGLKGALKLPAKTLSFAGGKLKIPVLRQLLDVKNWALQESTRTILSKARDDISRGTFLAMDQARLGTTDLPRMMEHFSSAAFNTARGGMEETVAALTRGTSSQLGRSPSAQRIMLRVFKSIVNQHEMAEEAVARGTMHFNPLKRWTPKEISKTIDDVLDAFGEQVYQNTLDGLLKRMDPGEAVKAASRAKAKAMGNKVMVGQELSQALYRDMNEAMRPIQGLFLYHDSFMYQFLKRFGLDGKENRRVRELVGLWLNWHGWLKNMWIFQVLPGRPAWVIRNLIDSQFRYMVAGGRMMDDLGKITEITFNRVIGRSAPFFSSAEAFGRALPGVGMSWARRIITGEYAKRGVSRLVFDVFKESYAHQMDLTMASIRSATDVGGLASIRHWFSSVFRGIVGVPYVGTGVALKDINSIAEFSWRIRLIHQASTDIFKRAERITVAELDSLARQADLSPDLTRRLLDVYSGAYDDPEKIIQLMKNVKDGRLENVVITADMLTSEVMRTIHHLAPHEQDALIKPILSILEDNILTAMARNQEVTPDMVRAWGAKIAKSLDEEAIGKSHDPLQWLKALKESSDRDEIARNMAIVDEILDIKDAFRPENIIPGVPERPTVRAVEEVIGEPAQALRRLMDVQPTTGARFAADWGTAARGTGTNVSFVDLPEDQITRVMRGSVELGNEGVAWLQVDLEKLSKMKVKDARTVVTRGTVDWIVEADSARVSDAISTGIFRNTDEMVQDLMNFIRNPAKLRSADPGKFNFFVEQLGRIEGSIDMLTASTGRRLRVLDLEDIIDTSQALRGVFDMGDEELSRMAREMVKTGNHIPQSTMQSFKQVRQTRAQLGEAIQTAIDAGKNIQASYLQSTQRFLSRLLGDMYGGRLGTFFREVVPGPLSKTGIHRMKAWDDFFQMGERVSRTINKFARDSMTAAETLTEVRRIDLSHMDILRDVGVKIEFSDSGAIEKMLFPRESGGRYVTTSSISINKFIKTLFGEIPGVDDPTKARHLLEMSWSDLDAHARGIERVAEATQKVAQKSNYIQSLKRSFLEHFKGSEIAEDTVEASVDMVDQMFKGLIKNSGLSEDEFWTKFRIGVTRESQAVERWSDVNALRDLHYGGMSGPDLSVLAMAGHGAGSGLDYFTINIAEPIAYGFRQFRLMMKPDQGNRLWNAIMRSGVKPNELVDKWEMIRRFKADWGNILSQKTVDSIEDSIKMLGNWNGDITLRNLVSAVMGGLEPKYLNYQVESIFRGSAGDPQIQKLFTWVMSIGGHDDTISFLDPAAKAMGKLTFKDTSQILDDLTLALSNKDFDGMISVIRKIKGVKSDKQARRILQHILGVDDTIDLKQKIGNKTLFEIINENSHSNLNYKWSPEDIKGINDWAEKNIAKLAGKITMDTDMEVFEAATSKSIPEFINRFYGKWLGDETSEAIGNIVRVIGANSVSDYIRPVGRLWKYIPGGARPFGAAAHRAVGESEEFFSTVLGYLAKEQRPNAIIHEMVHGLHDIVKVMAAEGIPGADYLVRDLAILNKYMRTDFTADILSTRLLVEGDTLPYFSNAIEFITRTSEVASREGWLGLYRLQQASYRVRNFLDVIPDFKLYRNVILNPSSQALREVNGKPLYETVLDLFVYSEGNVDDLIRARIGAERTILKALGGDEFLMHPTNMNYRLISDVEELRRVAEKQVLDVIEDLGKRWVKLSPEELEHLEKLRPVAVRDAVLRPRIYRGVMEGLDSLAKTDPDLAMSMRMYASQMENDLMDLIRKGMKGIENTEWKDWASDAVYMRWVGEPDQDEIFTNLVNRLHAFVRGDPINYGIESSLLRQKLANAMEEGTINIPPNPLLLKRLNHADSLVDDAMDQWNQLISMTPRWSGYINRFGRKPKSFNEFVSWMDDLMQRVAGPDAWRLDDILWESWVHSNKFGTKSMFETFGESATKSRMDFLNHMKGYIKMMDETGVANQSFLDALRFVYDQAANFDFIKELVGQGRVFTPHLRTALPVPWPTWRQPYAWQTWLGHNTDLAGIHKTIRDTVDEMVKGLIDAHAKRKLGVIRIPKDQAENVVNWLDRAYASKSDNLILSFEGNINPTSATFGRYIDGMEVGKTRGGIKIAGDNMLDYRQTSVIDEALKSIFPFWMFPSRSIVYWTGMLQRHPELLLWYNKFMSASQRELRQKGLVTTTGEPMPSLVGKVRVPGTNMWFDPVQVLSFRFFIPRPWILDRVTGRYEEEDGLSFDRLARRAMAAAEFFGFHALPWAKGYAEALTGEERGFEQFTFLPVLEMIPPWHADSMRASLRKTIFRSLADAPFWLPRYQFLDGQIERRMLGRALEEINATDDPAEKARIADEAKHAMGYYPKYDYNGEYIGYEVDIDRDHPRWSMSKQEIYESQYNLSLVGYFTGWYGREFSDADVQLYDLRHELNLIRDAINNEILQDAYFPKDLGPEELYQMYIEKRYDTAEGEIYDMAGQLSFVRSPSGDIIDDPTERKQRQIELLDRDERESAFWNSIEALNEQLQDDLARVPVGDIDTKRLYLDAYFTRRAAIDENPMFAEARRSWTFGYKPKIMIEQHFVDLAFQMYRETRPVRQDDENYNMYQTRLRAWEEQFDVWTPNILQSIQHTLTELVHGYTVEDGKIMLANREIGLDDLMRHVEGQMKYENFQKWWRARDTVYDALDMAYQEHYANKYWDYVQGAADRFEREARSRQFFETGKPTEDQLVDWVIDIYGDQFPEDAVRHAFQEKDTIDMKERLAPGTKDEKTVDDVWNILLWAGPSLSKLRKEIENVGGRSSDIDVWYATNGNPKAWGSELNFQKFYSSLEAAAKRLNLEEPTTVELAEWSHVRDLNDKFHRLMRETLGDEVQVVISRYYNLSGNEQKEFQAEHPEIDQYLILRDAYAVQFPAWAKYFHERAYREIQEGKTPHWLERAGKTSVGSTSRTSAGAPGTRGAYVPRDSSAGSSGTQKIDRFTPMGYRGSIDPTFLSQHRLGRGGAGGRIKASALPTKLVKVIGEEGVDEIGDLVDNGKVVSSALENLLTKSKERYPDLGDVIDEVLEINRKRRKAYIDRS